MLKPIVDGFTYNIAYRPLCEQYDPIALAAMETLRRAKTYKPFWISSPPDPRSNIIPAYGSFEYQAPVPAGSWLWGWCASQAGDLTLAAFVIQATEICSGIQLFSQHVKLAPFGYTAGNFAGVNLLSRPVPINDPGIAIEIYNTGGTATSATNYIQVLFMFDAPRTDICEEGK